MCVCVRVCVYAMYIPRKLGNHLFLVVNHFHFRIGRFENLWSFRRNALGPHHLR